MCVCVQITSALSTCAGLASYNLLETELASSALFLSCIPLSLSHSHLLSQHPCSIWLKREDRKKKSSKTKRENSIESSIKILSLDRGAKDRLTFRGPWQSARVLISLITTCQRFSWNKASCWSVRVPGCKLPPCSLHRRSNLCEGGWNSSVCRQKMILTHWALHLRLFVCLPACLLV